MTFKVETNNDDRMGVGTHVYMAPSMADAVRHLAVKLDKPLKYFRISSTDTDLLFEWFAHQDDHENGHEPEWPDPSDMPSRDILRVSSASGSGA